MRNKIAIILVVAAVILWGIVIIQISELIR